MALKTKTISAVSFNGNHKFTLKIVETETIEDTNKSKATMTFTLSPATSTAYGWNYTSKQPVTYTVKVGDTTYTGAIMSYTKNSTVTILSKNLTPYHEIDGTRDMPISFEVKSLSGSLLPGSASASGVMTLTKINRGSTFVANGTWYIGRTPARLITLSAYDSNFYHQIKYSMGDVTGWLTGGSKDYVQGDGSYLITIPSAVAEQIPNATSGKMTVTVETFYYNEETSTYVSVGSRSKTVTVYVRSNEFAPYLNPRVTDINEETLALTGDDSRLIKGYSTAYLNPNAVALGGATLKTLTIQNSSGKYEVIQDGVATLPKVKDNEFYFTATDSRGFSTSWSVTCPMVDYVPLTINKELTRPNGEGVMDMKIYGNYWDDSFGAQDNTLALHYRYFTYDDEGYIADSTGWVPVSADDISLSGWQETTVYDEATETYVGTGEFTNEFTYEANLTITIPDYTKQWIFEARATDMLRDWTTDFQSVKAIPVFDWSEEDFNFNCAVGMQGDLVVNGNLTCNGVMSNATGFIGRNAYSGTANVISDRGILSTGGSHAVYAYVLNPFNLVFLRLYVSGLSSAVSASTSYNTLCTLDSKFGPPGNIALTVSAAKQLGVLINASGDIRVIAPEGITTGTQMYISGLYPLSSNSELYQSSTQTASIGGDE